MELSDKRNEVIYFMDRSRKVFPIPKGVQADLEIVDDKKKVRIISSRTIIGRGDVDLKLDDRKVSEEHAAIGYFDGIFFILDLKSKNGTFVNGERVVERVLHDGDEIKLGTKILTFYVSGRLHEEATERWPSTQETISKILEMISGKKGSGKFEDPTRIVIDGGGKKTSRASMRQVFFEVLSGLDKGKKFNFLQKEILIGRGRGDLPLTDPDVSKNHAEVVIYGPDQIFIRDLGSTNGTFVSDKKVDRKQLKNGDLVRTGSTMMEVNFGEVVAPPYMHQNGDGEKTTKKYYGKMFLQLEIVEGRDKGKKIRLKEGEFTIGRDKAQISLKDTDVSRKHAKIKVSKGAKILIMDLSSTNGTFVNGKRVKIEEVKIGDKIKVGNTIIKIC